MFVLLSKEQSAGRVYYLYFTHRPRQSCRRGLRSLMFVCVTFFERLLTPLYVQKKISDWILSRLCVYEGKHDNGVKYFSDRAEDDVAVLLLNISVTELKMNVPCYH